MQSPKNNRDHQPVSCYPLPAPPLREPPSVGSPDVCGQKVAQAKCMGGLWGSFFYMHGACRRNTTAVIVTYT